MLLFSLILNCCRSFCHVFLLQYVFLHKNIQKLVFCMLVVFAVYGSVFYLFFESGPFCCQNLESNNDLQDRDLSDNIRRAFNEANKLSAKAATVVSNYAQVAQQAALRP